MEECEGFLNQKGNVGALHRGGCLPSLILRCLLCSLSFYPTCQVNETNAIKQALVSGKEFLQLSHLSLTDFVSFHVCKAGFLICAASTLLIEVV